LRDCRNVIAGAPFAGEGESPLWTDFSRKVAALDISETTKTDLMNGARDALLNVVGPAYKNLIVACEEQQRLATTDDGVWKLPEGEAYYAYMLRQHTTTDISADEIHAFGMEDVNRIHGEMRDIMKAVGFSGDLKEFFSYLKSDPSFFYPQNESGRSAYLARTREVIEEVRARLDQMFLSAPRAPLDVKAVEAYREQSATTAFYQGPGAFDGRPGTYYVNLFDMQAMPKYEIESLAYHEALPGHHMQIALAQEIPELPSFRRFSSRYTAYVEGWGLYCEQLPKEMGLYDDPYSDFGRLSAELWRACRLVVDTGIHSASRRWSREKAIQYLRDNTPNSERDVTNSIERYIVQPGQATAYKVGMRRIQDLRAEAEAALGGKFDVRAFHDVVLVSGAVPLDVLSDNVRDWVSAVSPT